MCEQGNRFLNGSCIAIDGGIGSSLHDPTVQIIAMVKTNQTIIELFNY